MKNSISRLAAVLLPAVLLTVSCEKSQESEPVKLTAPMMTLDMATQNTATISWKPVDGAASYTYQLDVERAETVTSTSVTFENLATASQHVLKMKAVSPHGEDYDSDWAAFSFSTLDRPAPTFVIEEVQALPTEFTYRIKPSDNEVTWYSDWNTQAMWEDWDNLGGLSAIMSSDLDKYDSYATSSGQSLSAILNLVLMTGEQTITVKDYVEPGSTNYVYVYGWNPDGTFTSMPVYLEIATPDIKPSELASPVTISLNGRTSRDLDISVEAKPEVGKYYTVVGYKSVIEANMAADGKEAMFEAVIEDGTPSVESSYTDSRIVDAGQSYMVCVAGYDKEGGWFLETASIDMPEREKPAAESPLIAQLDGTTWEGRQTLRTSAGTVVTEFTATVSSKEASMDYSQYNELALKLEGYAGFEYNGVIDLVNVSENEVLKQYGPKFILSIDGDDNITIDVTQYQTPVCTYRYDNFTAYLAYLKSYDGTTFEVSESERLNVELSADGHQMTISDTVPGSYPSLMVYDGDWSPVVLGVSDITLIKVD